MSTRTKTAITALVALTIASFGASASNLFTVSAGLSHKGEALGAPSAVVREGEPATIEVAGPKGYKLTLTVNGIAADQIKVVTAVETSHGTMAPTVVVTPGVPATVTVGNLGLAITVHPGGS